MATGTLGGLLVTLGLNTAEYTDGLTKSQQQAKVWANEFDSMVTKATMKGGLMDRALAKIANTAIDLTKQFIGLGLAVGQYQDISERTGADPAGLAAMRTAADVAGTSINEVATTMQRMIRVISRTKDESSGAGKALKTIGIGLSDFKKMGTVEQVDALAKGFANMADNGRKVALVGAITGGRGGGGTFLNFLKEYGKETEHGIGLTNEQIKQADDLSDSYKRVASQTRQLIEVMATAFLGTLSDVTLAASDLVKAMFGINKEAKALDTIAFQRFAEDAADWLAWLVDKIKDTITFLRMLAAMDKFGQEAFMRLFGGRKGTVKEAWQNMRSEMDFLTAGYDERGSTQLAMVARRRERKEQQAAEAAAAAAARSMGLNTGAGESIDDLSRQRGGAKERVSEADKYIASMRKQIEKTEELTNVEKLRRDLARGAFGEVKMEQAITMQALAERMDAEEKLIRVEKSRQELEKSFATYMDEQERRQSDVDAASGQSLLTIQDQNKELEKEIMLLGKDARQRAEILNLTLQQRIADNESAIAGGQMTPDAISRRQAENEALRRQQQLNLIKAGRDTWEAAPLVNDEEKLKATSEALADSISDGIMKGFREGETFADVFINELKAQFAKTILSPIIKPIVEAGNRLMAQMLSMLESQIFGGGGEFPDDYSGPAAGGGPVSPFSIRRVNELRTEGLNVNGQQFLLMGAQGGTIDSNPRGKGGLQIVQHINVGQGVSRNEVAAAMTMAKETAKAEILRSMQTNGRFALRG